MPEKIRVLVAEDDHDVKWILDYILEQAGYQLVNAYDGQEAVDRYRECRPHLVLMDIKMPIKTVAVAIREILDLDPGANIIAVTAYNHSRETLGVPVLRKGFHKEQLLEAVRASLDRPFQF
jgi:two-component system chemotaxis response regulator CheY